MHSTVNQLRQHADHHATQRKHAHRFRVQSHHSQNGRPEAKAPKSSSRERDHDQEVQENVLRSPGSRSQQAYVGGPKEYQAYQQLRADKKLSREDFQDAEMYQDATMEWSSWEGGEGVWGPMGGPAPGAF